MPADFVWPTYEGESYDHVEKERPLTFLAQFNCMELAKFDRSIFFLTTVLAFLLL